jgi:hypothetical protein
MRWWGTGFATIATLLAAAALAQPADEADSRILAAARAAESLQGPLDGRWVLTSGDGKPIFVFQITDKSLDAEPEGVWRDARKAAVAGDIGPIDQLSRSRDSLTMSFAASPGSPLVTITLKNVAGAWTGDLREGPATTRVSLRPSS